VPLIAKISLLLLFLHFAWDQIQRDDNNGRLEVAVGQLVKK
jgi:hypothetical protein